MKAKSINKKFDVSYVALLSEIWSPKEFNNSFNKFYLLNFKQG